MPLTTWCDRQPDDLIKDQDILEWLGYARKAGINDIWIKQIEFVRRVGLLRKKQISVRYEIMVDLMGYEHQILTFPKKDEGDLFGYGLTKREVCIYLQGLVNGLYRLDK